jgi:hypothetical protein
LALKCEERYLCHITAPAEIITVGTSAVPNN